jgi:prepilin-type N-terminal cleavage/methylation domain-containing protein
MAKNDQAGFTLIELILVMAISSSLLMIAFVGQGQLRAQAQFDSAVNKIVSSVAAAHTEAASAINLAGTGDGTIGCGAAAAQDYVYGGIAWVATGSGDISMEYYKVIPLSGQASESCIFATQKVGLPTAVQINISNPATAQGGRELFVRRDNGGLDALAQRNF